MPDATTARGYVGGREYDLTEMWVRGRWSKIDLGIGRLVVPEADAMRIDGARLWVHLQKHWDLSVYAGGYPDPYSRSFNTDYVTGNALGKGGGIAFGGGASVRYSYDRIYGWFSANGAYLGGDDDGGPVLLNAFDAGRRTSPAVGANPQTETLRAYVTWNNFWRPIKYVDFFHDLVVDVAGAAGVQLTRLNVFIAAHVNKIFTLRLGYDHMSAIAIEMYLSHLLANRTDFIPGSIENNLTISRTARDEGRLTLEAQLGRTVFTAEGRMRRRVLVTPSNDPQFVYPAASTDGDPGSQVAPTLGYDATLAVRNRGSLWELRPSFWVTYLSDYRARDIFVGLGLGRDFLHEALFVDLSFTFANVHDDGADASMPCATVLLPGAVGQQLQTCYGTRKGNNYEADLSIGGTPFKHWFMFLDYRAGIATSEDEAPAVITHVLLGRLEARY